MAELLSRKRLVLAKIEPVYGTDSAPVAATNAILVRSVTFKPLVANEVERQLLRSYFGANQKLMASTYGQCDIEVELAGSGTAGTPPKWGPLIRGCGYQETITAGVSTLYAPVTNSPEAITIHGNHDGVLHKFTGVRGSPDFSLANDQIGTIKFSYTGLFSPVVDSPISDGVYTGWTQPVLVSPANTSVSLHGTTIAALSELTIQGGNDVKYRSKSNRVLIMDRKVAGSITFDAHLMAVKNWFDAARNGTLGAIAVAHGTAPGNIVEFAGPAVGLSGPEYGDDDGVTTLKLSTTFNPVAGNDELTITVK